MSAVPVTAPLVAAEAPVIASAPTPVEDVVAPTITTEEVKEEMTEEPVVVAEAATVESVSDSSGFVVCLCIFLSGSLFSFLFFCSIL